MIRLVAIVALAGCIHDHYECTTDADCNLGVAGRCETDHHCTAFDMTCASNRRYTVHSDVVSNTCLDDHATPVDECAPGQPPAFATGCAATVCTSLPACCTTGWSEACVLEAQRRCPSVRCDTRIAITATKAGITELWDLRYDGTKWSATSRIDRTTLLAYAAPAPGGATPRTVGFTAAGEFAVDDGGLELDIPIAAHDFQDASSVDFDRDGRDTVALAAQDLAGNHFLEIVKLDTSSIREIATSVSTREAWGDYDHDAFPDGVAAAGGRITFLANIDEPDHSRGLDDSTSTGFGGLPTPMSPPVRSFEFEDVDGDGALDLIAFGNSLRVHMGGDRISDVALVNIDCDPPTAMTGACDPALASFSGSVVPAGTVGATIIGATFPTRGAYTIRVHANAPNTADITPLPLTGASTEPLLAVVVRDINGDHKLDVVAIDASLAVYVALGPNLSPLAETPTRVIPTTTTGFTAVRTSTSGASR